MGIKRIRWVDTRMLSDTGYMTARCLCRGSYWRSRENVMKRWRAAGLSVSERTEAHGARVLVLGD